MGIGVIAYFVFFHALQNRAEQAYEERFKISSTWNLDITGSDLARDFTRVTATRRARVLIFDEGVEPGVQTPTGEELLLDSSFLQQLSPSQLTKSHGNFVASIIQSSHLGLSGSRVVDLQPVDIFEPAQNTNHALILGLKKYFESEESFDVANFSLKISYSAVYDVMDIFHQARGTIFVLAAGNESSHLSADDVTFRSKHAWVISNYSASGDLHPSSNYGAGIFLTAPGSNVLVASPSFQLPLQSQKHLAYTNVTGTSFSAPLVTAALANFSAIAPNLGEAVARAVFSKSAIDVFEPGRDDRSGYGLLNAYLACRVAYRLKLMNRRTPKEALDSIQNDPSLFDFSEEAASLQTQSETPGRSEVERLADLRKKYFLTRSATDLKQLQAIYSNLGQNQLTQLIEKIAPLPIALAQ